MQKVFCVAGAREGPIFLLAPLVRSHNEKSYGLGMREIVGHVLEEKVVPAQRSFIFIKWGGRAKIYIADLAAGAGVPADRDHEMLSAARGFVLAMQLHSDVVAQRSAEKNVVPRRDRQRGYADVGIVILNGPALPILVIAGMGQPVEKVRSQRMQQVCIGGCRR